MEAHAKPASGFSGYEGDGGDVVGGLRRFPVVDCTLRAVALVTTLAAAVVMGLDRQDATVSIKLASSLPPISVPVTAKSSYSSAFVYFVIVNSIACAYAALSLALSAAGGRRKGGAQLLLFAGDLVTSMLLVTGNGATAAIGYVGKKGNSHMQWKPVCDVFGRFCAWVTACLCVSLLGCMAFALLLLLAFHGAHRRSLLGGK